MVDTDAFLNSVLELINDNGYLFIVVPGLFNSEYYFGIRHNLMYYLQNAHVYTFTLATLINVLKICRLKIKIVKSNEKVMLLAKKISFENFEKTNIDREYKNEYFRVIDLIKYLNKYMNLSILLNKIGYYRIKNFFSKDYD